MKDPVVGPGNDDHHVSSLLQELAPPALPAHRLSAGVLWLTWPPIRCGQGEQQQGDHDVHAHRPRGFLGRRFHAPRRLTVLDIAMLYETAIIILKGRPGPVHRGVGQEHRVAPWPIVPMPPLAPHHGVDGGGLEVTAVGVPPMFGRPLRIIRRQPDNPHDLGLQPLGRRGVAGPMPYRMRPAPDGHAFTGSGLGLGVHRHRHGVFRRYPNKEIVLIEPPQIGALPKPLINDHRMPTSMASQVGPSLRHQGSHGQHCMRLDRHHLPTRRGGRGVFTR
jgi:hypothetical protein